MNHLNHPPALPALRAILHPVTLEGAIARGLVVIGGAFCALAVLHWLPNTPATIGVMGLLIVALTLGAIAIRRADRVAASALLAYTVLGVAGALIALTISYTGDR
jgi:hypothetical protein